MLALLASTGLRISEALGLRFADVTADGLLIRETKFRKTRLVPLHDSAAAGLERYLMRRRQHASDDDHVFIGEHGRPLSYPAVQGTFLTLLRRAGPWSTPGGHRPRLHDLRHALLAADVVGFSKLAGSDEERTLARLRALRSDLIDPTIAVHNGRIVKRTGDGVLIEFRSVVDAVRCAIEMQNGMIGATRVFRLSVASSSASASIWATWSRRAMAT